jgi:hypothetical protein
VRRLKRLGGIEEAVKGGAADAEHAGRTNLVAVHQSEDAGDVAEDGSVKVGVVARAIEGQNGEGCRGDRGGPLEARDIERADPLAWRIEGGRRDGGLEFPDVAGPRPGSEAADCAWSEAAEGFAVLESPLAEEKAGKEGDVVAAVAQRGEKEANGGKVAGEVGAKRSGGSEATERLRGAHDELAGSDHGKTAEAFVGGPFKEVAEKALLVGG